MTNSTNQVEVDGSRHANFPPPKIVSPEGKENGLSVSEQYRCQNVCPYGPGDGNIRMSAMRVVNGNGAFYASEVSLIPSWNSGFNRRLQKLKMKEKNKSKRQDGSPSIAVNNCSTGVGNTIYDEKDDTEERDGIRRTEDQEQDNHGANLPEAIVVSEYSLGKISLIPSGSDQFALEVQSLKVESPMPQKEVDHQIQEDATVFHPSETEALREDEIEVLSTKEAEMPQKVIPKIPASIIMEVIGSYTNDRKVWNSLASLSKETLAISKNVTQVYRPWPSIRWRATTTTKRCQAMYREQRQRRRNARGAVQTSARPRTVAFGKDYLCYGTDRGEVLLRNLHGDGSIHVRRGHKGCVDCVKCCGNWVFSAGDDLVTKIWNVTTMSCEAILDDHLDNITSISILPMDSRESNCSSSSSFSCILVATAGLDGDVHLYAVYCEGNKVVYTKHVAIFAEEGFPKQTHSIVLFEKDGRKSLVSGGQDGRLRLWDVDIAIGDRIHGSYSDIETETPATKITDNTCIYRYDGEIKSIAISRDKERIAAAFGRTICHSYLSGKTLESYDFLHHHDHNHRFQRRLEQHRRLRNQGTMESFIPNDTEEDHWKVLKGHSGDIRCIDFSPDGKTVASACSDGSIRLWKLGEGTWKRKWKAHNGFMVRSLAVSPDGQSLLSAGSDGTIAIEGLFP